jgi:hypothetical protein
MSSKLPSSFSSATPLPFPSILRLEDIEASYRTTTSNIHADPHNPLRYIERGQSFSRAGFFDLAAADAYRALMLLESVIDPEGCEYVAGSLKSRCINSTIKVEENADPDLDQVDDDGQSQDEDEEEEDEIIPTSQEEYDANIGDTYVLLVASLMRCGCARDAYEFAVQGIRDLATGEHSSQNQAVSSLRKQIMKIKYLSRTRRHQKLDASNGERSLQSGEANVDKLDPSTLDAQGYAKRVLYPWNDHEPDRKSEITLNLLNEKLRTVAPKCEVRAVALPALHRDTQEEAAAKLRDNTTETSTKNDVQEVSIQLGLFAKERIQPGEVLLRESSLLTATNRLHDDLCDACNSLLPELSSEHPPVACEDCDDTIFCNSDCRDRAQEVYHHAICGQDGLESIGKDIPDPKDKADYLYLLLLGRAIAMAATQDVHPLELPEVKYIWGDFHDLSETDFPVQLEDKQQNFPETGLNATLPFSFQLNILQPMRFLEEMGLDPFKTLSRYDTWILNTLYAKFRGTASGRLSTWDGGPEVCAVHPLWCLANHSCDPNVRWEWGGEITFVARTASERAVWKGKDGADDSLRQDRASGIAEDEEIVNHYCDIDLAVKDRREWAQGALGGSCRCRRCVWEASLEAAPAC